MFRLSVIDRCSYCLEQSYLLNVVDMVMPQVFIRKNREGKYVGIHVCTHTDWNSVVHVVDSPTW